MHRQYALLTGATYFLQSVKAVQWIAVILDSKFRYSFLYQGDKGLDITKILKFSHLIFSDERFSRLIIIFMRCFIVFTIIQKAFIFPLISRKLKFF